MVQLIIKIEIYKIIKLITKKKKLYFVFEKKKILVKFIFKKVKY